MASSRTILVAVSLDDSGVKAVEFVRQHIVRALDRLVLLHVIPDVYPALSPTLVGFAGEGVLNLAPEYVCTPSFHSFP